MRERSGSHVRRTHNVRQRHRTPSPPVLLSRPSRVTAPGTEGSTCPYTSGDPSPLLVEFSPPMPCRVFQRSQVSRRPVPLLLLAMRAGAARVPRTLRAAAATKRFDTPNAYYDIAFGVSGVRTDTPPYSGTLLPLCHVSAERGENFFGKAKILLR